MSVDLRARLTALLGRIASFFLTVFGAAVLVSALLALAPGDAADLSGADGAAAERLRVAWQLEGPLPDRVVAILKRWAGGDLGSSWTVRPGAPVAELIANGAWRSSTLFIGSMALVLPWATGLALLGPRWRGFVQCSRVLSVAPAFLLAHLAVLALNALAFELMQRGLIDRPAWFALPDQASAFRTSLGIVVLALGSGTLAEIHDALADELQRIRQTPWVEAARGRGEPLALPIARHLLPVVASVLATKAAWLLGGLVVVEQVLQIRGLGALMWRAAELRDAELAAALALLAACLVAWLRLLADTVHLAVDPRLGGRRVA